MIRKTHDDSDRNYDIVHMIKKIAIGLEKKNVDDLRAIAHELEAWKPHGNWDKLDAKTKVFVEHILMALGRLQLGFEMLDKGAEELTDIRQKMEKDEIHGLMEGGDKKAAEEFLDSVSECNCSICKSSKCGKCRRVIDHANSKIFSDYGICLKCYSEEPDIDEIYKDESIVPKSKYAGAPYDQEEDEERIRKALDRQDKLAKKKCSWGIDGCDCMQDDYADAKTGFVCFKCGQRKIGRSTLEDIVGNKMCGRCARALGGKEKGVIHGLMEEDKSDFKKNMDELKREYDELKREANGLAQGITTENLDRFCKRNLDSVDEEQKFTCEKCGERKRSHAPGASNCKEVDGHKICAICYRAFRNWFVKTDKKLDGFWVGNDKLSRDEREKRLSDLSKMFSLIHENFGFRDSGSGWVDWKKGIDWDRYHKKRRGRFKKDELSDEEKDDLK